MNVKEFIKGNAYNPDVYRDDTYTWQEGDYTVYRTTAWSAPGCHDGCGVLYYVKDGKVEKVEGDPNNGFNQGALCMRCLRMTEAINDENRLKYPMKRDPKDRGLDKWERISWDEAYDMIVEKAQYYTEHYSAASIAMHQGTGRNVTWHAPWLGYVGFRTPNVLNGYLAGDSCYTPRAGIMALACGDFLIADMSQTHPDRYDNEEWHLPGVILVWGCNPVVSSADGFLGQWIIEAMKRGSKVVVIDPRLTWIANKAEYWIQLRPGTDAAVVLAMMHVIIEEDLWDHDFVDCWCEGFEDLAEAVKDWTPERAAEVAWADADVIRDAARFIATNGPVAMHWGVATDMQASATTLCHGILDLVALTGSVDVPGGSIIMPGHAFGLTQEPTVDPRIMDGLAEYYGGAEKMMRHRIGVKTFPFKNSGVYAQPSPDMVVQHIETYGELSDTDPKYPIKMGVYMATNPVSNMAAEAPRVMEAMKKIEFCVFIDYTMTASCMACGDLVLPCAMSPERDSVRGWWWPLRSIIKVCDDYYEARSDEQITFDLIKRLNPDFPLGDNVHEWLSHEINYGELDYGFEGIKERVIDWPEWKYRKYATGDLRSDGSLGFRTYSGRFALSCPILEQMGLSPVPSYEEPHEGPVSTPELMEEYPFILTTGRRSYEFFHSEHRHMPSLRHSHPDPLVEMTAATAAALGLNEGDWVWIENMRGRARERVKIFDGMDDRIIMAEHGWWFPEADPENLFNTFDSNINNLTTQCDPGKSGIGAAYKSTICKVYKCTEENSKVLPTEQVLKRGGFEYERKYIQPK